MSQFTKRAIAETFVSLLNERPLDKIAIKDIVDECEINRNTFYYHYQDIYALLEEVLADRLQQLFGDSRSDETRRACFFRAVQYAIDHKRALYHIYNSSRRDQLEKYLIRVTGDSLLEVVREKAGDRAVAEEDLRFIAEVYQFALVGKLLSWLRNDMKEDPREIYARAEKLLQGNVERMLENADSR